MDVLQVSKLLKSSKYIVIRLESDEDIQEEITLEVDEVIYSEYAGEEVLEIDYYVDLTKSCEYIIEVTPVLVVKY